MVHQASAPGKMILLGEHGVVYGFPALAAPIALRAEVSVLTGQKSNRLLTRSHVSKWHRSLLQRAIASAADIVGVEKHFHLSIESDLPLSMGLGSSGAISVAVARALFDARGTSNPSVSQVDAVALEMEKCFHGTPSGIDHSTSSREQIIYFKNKKVKTIHIKSSLELVVALVGQRASTKETVQSLRTRAAEYPKRCQRLFGLIGQGVDEGSSALQHGELASFGNLMDINHGCLSALGLSGARIDAAVHLMRQAGAYGAKLTGAGGDGGAVIGLFPDAKRAVLKLKKQGLDCFVSVISAKENGDSN